jgi:hypothetical protein
MGAALVIGRWTLRVPSPAHIVSGSTRKTVRRMHGITPSTVRDVRNHIHSEKTPTVDLLHDAADWPWPLSTECTAIFRTGVSMG